MSYIEFTKSIHWKSKNPVVVEDPNDKMAEDTRWLILEFINASPIIKRAFESTDNAKSFYNTFTEFNDLKIWKEEGFYQCKLGYRVPGVPSKIPYILNKAIKTYGVTYPNKTLQSVYKLLKPYANSMFMVEGEQVNLEDVINFIFKMDIEYITPRKLRSGLETYIPNIDKVAIIPDDIYKEVSGEIRYDSKLGLVCGEDNPIILRELGGRIGLVKDDLNLSEAI